MIATLARFNVRGERRPGRVGIWVDRGGGREDKIAAIGVRVRHWVTYHGVSLNVDCDLTHFRGIVPCGISGPQFGVTSLLDLGIVPLAEVDAACCARRSARCSAPTRPAARSPPKLSAPGGSQTSRHRPHRSARRFPPGQPADLGGRRR